MAPSKLASLLVGFFSSVAGITALNVPVNSHDEENFGGQTDEEVKKLAKDVPTNSHDEVKKLAKDVPANRHDEQNFGGRSDQEVKELFEKWIVKHHKSYNDLTEREKRFGIFKDKLLRIDQHNSGNHSYKKGLNYFSDLTYEEVRSTYCGAFEATALNQTPAKQVKVFDAPRSIADA